MNNMETKSNTLASTQELRRELSSARYYFKIIADELRRNGPNLQSRTVQFTTKFQHSQNPQVQAMLAQLKIDVVAPFDVMQHELITKTTGGGRARSAWLMVRAIEILNQRGFNLIVRQELVDIAVLDKLSN